MNFENVDVDQLDPEVPLAQQGVDSLDMISFYFKLEKTFSFKIGKGQMDTEKWGSISSITQSVNEKLAE
ncbi:MAG: acyl carrier protein [Verrucomicrobiota bacterium]